MKRQLIIERWWVWRFFHVRKSDDDLKEQYWNKEERNKMDYETFKQEMTEDLKQRLYERGACDVEMSFHNVEKANQHYESLTVRQEGSNVGVNFNIENAFAEYEHTGDYAGVLAESTHAIMQGLENVPSVDASELTNYEVMKEKLSIEVISAETNAELLTKVPHESMEDMAVVYRFVLESNDTGRASILVTNDMIDHMGVTHEQLKVDALENAPEIRPAVIQGMSEVMREMMGPEAFEMFGLPEEQEEMMYVATVPDKNSGAGCLLIRILWIRQLRSLVETSIFSPHRFMKFCWYLITETRLQMI